MRVLLLHNRYRQPGGEERAVADTAALLRGAGHTVELLDRSSDAVPGRAAARGLLSGGLHPGEIAEAVRRSGAEVVHAHNVQPLFGWRALAAAREAGARTVLHLHNYRLFCAIAVHYRDGAPCHRCHGSWTLPGLALRCRGGTGEAAAYAAGLAAGWRRLVDGADELVAVSGATAARLRAQGLEREPAVLHNFVAAAAHGAVEPGAGAAPAEPAHVLVAGRLVEEKGFDTAIAACRSAGVPLVVAGDGPDRPRLTELAAGACVHFAGHVGAEELAALRARAAAVLVPSRWEEPCPYAALDGLAAGVPVIGSDRGGLPELLEGQAILRPGDTSAWAAAVAELWRSADLRAERSRAALQSAGERFGEERYLERLLTIYRGTSGSS